MYKLAVFDWDSGDLVSESYVKSIRKVIEASNKRHSEIGLPLHPAGYYFTIPNNTPTCVAPGIYVTRIEYSPPPLMTLPIVKDEYNLDVIDGLRGIYHHLSAIQQYRNYIGASKPINKEVHACSEQILHVLRLSREILETLPGLVVAYSTS
jgi:hypothetical protein